MSVARRSRRDNVDVQRHKPGSTTPLRNQISNPKESAQTQRRQRDNDQYQSEWESNRNRTEFREESERNQPDRASSMKAEGEAAGADRVLRSVAAKRLPMVGIDEHLALVGRDR